MKCCLCDSVQTNRLGSIGSKHAAVTSDSALIARAAVVWRCADCGHLQKIHNEEDWRVIGEIYDHYAGHRLSGGREQLVFPSGLPPRPRSYHALEQCLSYLPNRGNLLDYGAGDGAVLKSAGKLLPDWRLHALDLTDKFREEILHLPGVVAFTTIPEQLPAASFDMIVLWHTLEHVPQPAEMLRSFHTWLKPRGQVLVQVPDVARNPYDLGVIDHVSHFTNTTLQLCARRAGFELEADGHQWTHNCLSVLMARTEQKAAEPILDGVENPFEWLNARLRLFADRVGKGPYAIFGTGMASLLLAAQLPGTPQCFLDEDDLRAGGEINGIPILHPSGVQHNALIIMPFLAETSRAIMQRLTSQFPNLKAEHFISGD